MILDEKQGLIRFQAEDDTEDRLKSSNIFLAMHMNTTRVRRGDILTFLRGKHIEPFSTFGANVLPQLGFCSFSHSNLSPFVSTGRYCSISWRVNIWGEAHPTDRLTTSILTYMPNTHMHRMAVKFFEGEAFRPKPPTQKRWPTIGHDVWIGQDVLLGRGITVGNGCVIGAGSVVTKDVPPYAIVGGNPAKIIRYRFGDSVVERLLASEWWRYSFTDFAHLSWAEPARFIDELAELEASKKISPYQPEKIDVAEILGL